MKILTILAFQNTVQYCTALHGTVLLVQYGTVWYSTELYVTVWHCMVQINLILLYKAQSSMVWHSARIWKLKHTLDSLILEEGLFSLADL